MTDNLSVNIDNNTVMTVYITDSEMYTVIDTQDIQLEPILIEELSMNETLINFVKIEDVYILGIDQCNNYKLLFFNEKGEKINEKFGVGSLVDIKFYQGEPLIFTFFIEHEKICVNIDEEELLVLENIESIPSITNINETFILHWISDLNVKSLFFNLNDKKIIDSYYTPYCNWSYLTTTVYDNETIIVGGFNPGKSTIELFYYSINSESLEYLFKKDYKYTAPQFELYSVDDSIYILSQGSETFIITLHIIDCHLETKDFSIINIGFNPTLVLCGNIFSVQYTEPETMLVMRDDIIFESSSEESDQESSTESFSDFEII